VHTLIDCAETAADDYFAEPMSQAEIEKTARSAWRYECEGKNWIGQEARSQITRKAYENITAASARHGSDAFVLLILLQYEHTVRCKRGETFCLNYEAMAKGGCIKHWSEYRYRSAARVLIGEGYIECVHKGRGKGNPSQYRLQS